MRQHSLRYWLAGRFYNLAYTEWGDPAAPPVLCVHGLTRTGRDFDILAAHLAGRYRVICPDLPGRGRSDWLDNPASYEPFAYLQVLSHLLARIDRPVAWIGTSLGGICGMAAAASAGNPLNCLILNDIGPLIPAAGLARIRDYAGSPPHFADIKAAEAYLRIVHAPFGALTDAQWADMAQQSTRAAPEGGITLHYDPAIMLAMQQQTEIKDIDLWDGWRKITTPILAIRGGESDLLTPDIFARMHNDGAETYEVPGVGHAPALMDLASLTVIEDFLMRQVQI